jgi:hypothetical protein
MGVADDYAVVAERFGAIAERYCAIVDASTQMDKIGFLFKVYRILPELIGDAISLPDTDPWERNVPDDPNEPDDMGQDLSKSPVNLDMRHEAWQVLYESLKEKLGDSNLYWEVFNPVTESEAIQASLADDIAGVYQDLKNGLALRKEEGAVLAEVIWEWRLLFYSHWGEHATGALRTIHIILRNKMEDGDIA